MKKLFTSAFVLLLATAVFFANFENNRKMENYR